MVARPVLFYTLLSNPSFLVSLQTQRSYLSAGPEVARIWQELNLPADCLMSSLTRTGTIHPATDSHVDSNPLKYQNPC